MPKRTNSTAQGKRPERPEPSNSTPKKPPFKPQITPEEALRRSKLSNKEKQAEAEAARDAAEARKKAEREASWWDHGTGTFFRPGSPGPTRLSAGCTFWADEANDEKPASAYKTKPPQPSTGSADRFIKTESKADLDAKERKRKKEAEKARRNAEEKTRKREKKMQEEFEENRQRDAALRALLSDGHTLRQQYQHWVEDCNSFFSDPVSDSSKFPIPIASGFRTCREMVCVKGEKLGFCHHQLEQLFRGNGEYDMVWLKKERLRWHPDKFTGRGEAQALAQEMFQMIQRLVDGIAE